jgi:hypothetical protein
MKPSCSSRDRRREHCDADRLICCARLVVGQPPVLLQQPQQLAIEIIQMHDHCN